MKTISKYKWRLYDMSIEHYVFVFFSFCDYFTVDYLLLDCDYCMSVLNELKKIKEVVWSAGSVEPNSPVCLLFCCKWTFIWDTEGDSNRIHLITGDRWWCYCDILINDMQSQQCCSLVILNNAYTLAMLHACMHTDQTISFRFIDQCLVHSTRSF